MAFDLKTTHYYLGVWRARLVDQPGDVMAMVWKDEADGLWHLKIRFRYYKDDKFFNSKDERSWTHYVSTTGDASGGEKFKDVMDHLLSVGGMTQQLTDVLFIPCHGDGDAMAKIMLNPERPGTQWVEMTEEQETEYLRTHILPEGVEPKGDL